MIAGTAREPIRILSAVAAVAAEGQCFEGRPFAPSDEVRR